MMASGGDTIPGPESFAPSAIRFLDCQAQLIGAEGYRALAAPGSTASILLTGLITLLIAFIGYRMLLGQRSEEHTSELQSLMRNSYAVCCLKKKSHKQNA